VVEGGDSMSEPTLCRRCDAWFYKIPASECDCKEGEE